MLPGGFLGRQMPVNVRRLLRRFYGRLEAMSWPLLAVLVTVHFCVSFVLMLVLGESALTDLRTFWYFYVTTATTVGYGDYAPQTGAGRLATTLLIMPGGILLLTAALAKFAQGLIDRWRASMRGNADLSELEGHILVLGWLGRRSQRMVQLLQADPSEEREIVVLAHQPENPDPPRVRFVSCELLSDPEALAQAGIAGASLVIAMGRDDHETLSAALSAGAINPEAHLVAFFVDQAPADILQMHCRHAESIVSMSIENTVRAAQDPGASRLVRQLVSSLEGQANVYRLVVPGAAATGSMAFWPLLVHFKQQHDATLIAVHREGEEVNLNPAADLCVHGGDDLYLIARQRLTPDDVAWDSVSACAGTADGGAPATGGGTD
jgi:voltage-gated potassium channel